MTTLEHFADSMHAMERSRWRGAQSLQSHERGQETIARARRLMNEINGCHLQDTEETS
jgi:hypothetical protein